MKLKARFLRWCHLIWHLMKLDLNPPHRAETVTIGWLTVEVCCSCGRTWD